MIKSISVVNKIRTFATNKLHCYIDKFKLNFPKLKKLEGDVFESGDKPEILFSIPKTVETKINSGINDKRILHMSTEYRGYSLEGCDNEFPNKYICIDPNGIRRLKPHIYLNYFEVRSEYARKGVYSQTIKKLTKFSKETEGCGGRIILDARNMNKYASTQIPSPALAHWKCGFRFADKKNNKIMEQVLNGELPLEKAPEGIMYLTI